MPLFFLIVFNHSILYIFHVLWACYWNKLNWIELRRRVVRYGNKHLYRRRYDKPPLVARCCYIANDLTNFTGDRQTKDKQADSIAAYLRSWEVSNTRQRICLKDIKVTPTTSNRIWNKQVICRRYAARCFVSLNISLSHSKSVEISPFDRSHTSSYWRSIVSMALCYFWDEARYRFHTPAFDTPLEVSSTLK